MDAPSLVAHARTDAILLPLSGWHWIAVVGEDRARFLHAMLSNRVEGLAPGGGNHAVLLDDRGRLIADLRVLVTEDAVLLGGLRAPVEDAAEKLDGYVIADDVEIESTGMATLAVVGPSAASRLAAAGGAEADALLPHGHRSVTIAGRSARLVRLPIFAPATFAVLADAADAEAVTRALSEAGIEAAGEAAEEAAEILRVESAVPAYGRDLDAKTLPLEAGLDEALDREKGCYLGQETVVRVLARGHVNWHVRGLALDAEAPVPAPGDEVVDASGKTVGTVRSAVASPTTGTPIALARIRREVADPGTDVRVRAGGGEHPARVVVGPFSPPSP